MPMKYLWLVDNPIKEETDVTYVTGKMDEMVELNRVAQEEKDMQNKVHWKGLLEPFIRFIHCLCDFDEIRQAFKTSLICMTRIELDGKRNSEIARKDPWEMIAQKWSDPDLFVHLVVIHICTAAWLNKEIEESLLYHLLYQFPHQYHCGCSRQRL